MSSSSLFLRVALRRLARRASLGHVGEPTEEQVPALSVLPVALPPHVNTTRRLGTTSTYRPEPTCLGSAHCTRTVPPLVRSSSAIRPFPRSTPPDGSTPGTQFPPRPRPCSSAH